MYQDGYVARREFFKDVRNVAFDIDMENNLEDIFFDRRCEGPADYSFLIEFLLRIITLPQVNQVHLEENIRFIIDKMDISFNLVRPQYHKKFVNQLSSLILFLMKSDKLEIILSQNQFFQNIINMRLLNNYLIIYFAYIVFTEFESVYSQKEYLLYFKAKYITKIVSQLYILRNNIDWINRKITDDYEMTWKWVYGN